MDQIVVVGLSLAGLRCVETLRREGFDGRIVAVSNETHEPYDRPPLSKEVLAGTREPDQISLRRDGLADLELDLRAPVSATGLDLGARSVQLDDGTTVDFDGLVLATGARPRRLPDQPDLEGVHMLRTLDDARAIRDRLDSGARRIVVIGAGFIGAEVAATCRGRGLDVTVVEAMEQPMVRGLGLELGAVCAQLHRDNGVDLRTGTGVDRIVGDKAVEAVELADGNLVEADLVVVGIGVVPATDWLDETGLTIDNGVVCDTRCRAAEAVVAAGDLCRFPNELFDGELMRLEHWTNAVEQGTYAAQSLLAELGEADEVDPFSPVPFVWSDQYDVKIQTVGRFSAEDEMVVAHGSLSERRFVSLFGRSGRLVGALGFSSPRRVMLYRRKIAERVDFADALSEET